LVVDVTIAMVGIAFYGLVIVIGDKDVALAFGNVSQNVFNVAY